MTEFLMHDNMGTVGVLVVDIQNPGQQIAEPDPATAAARPKVKALSDIPLGHKIALRDFQPGDSAIKYGVNIGKVVASIKTGEHVHVHNLKTRRW